MSPSVPLAVGEQLLSEFKLPSVTLDGSISSWGTLQASEGAQVLGLLCVITVG